MFQQYDCLLTVSRLPDKVDKKVVQQYWQSKVDISLNGKQQEKTKNYRPMTYEAASSLKKVTRSRHKIQTP